MSVGSVGKFLCLQRGICKISFLKELVGGVRSQESGVRSQESGVGSRESAISDGDDGISKNGGCAGGRRARDALHPE